MQQMNIERNLYFKYRIYEMCVFLEHVYQVLLSYIDISQWFITY